MQLEPFVLERYFAKHEFSAKYLLSSSDCEAFYMEWIKWVRSCTKYIPTGSRCVLDHYARCARMSLYFVSAIIRVDPKQLARTRGFT